MGIPSIGHVLVLVIIAVLLFGGKGKLTSLMGDAGEGLKAFRRGLTEDDAAAPPRPIQQVDAAPVAPVEVHENHTP